MLIYDIITGEYHNVPKGLRLRIVSHPVIIVNQDTYDNSDDYYPEFNDDDLDLVDHYKELFGL